MNQSCNNKIDKVMTDEQFNQIVEAILVGKYSWACVLILRFSGYNPSHYLPYRTYKRLIKDNSPKKKKSQAQKSDLARGEARSDRSQKLLTFNNN